MLTATEIKAEFANLTSAEKSERLISAGYVRSNGKADFVAFYEAILAEKSGKDPVSEKADLMLHFVNKWGGEYSPRVLKINWETYSQQVDIDGGYDGVDEFVSDYGMVNIGFYDSYADMMEDYDRWAVGDVSLSAYYWPQSIMFRSVAADLAAPGPGCYTMGVPNGTTDDHRHRHPRARRLHRGSGMSGGLDSRRVQFDHGRVY